jgi:GNAT superfamily N-acetyltransferase
VTSPSVATIRPFVSEDLEAVMALIASCYGDDMADRERWLHWHFGHPGATSGTVVAEAGGAIVGVQPLEVFDFRLNGKAVRGGVLTGVMVDPGHRRLGIFNRLLDACEGRAWELGADFVTTMPNDRSYPGFVKRGYVDPGDRMLLALPLAPAVIARRAVRSVPFVGGVAAFAAELVAAPRRLDRQPGWKVTERDSSGAEVADVTRCVEVGWPGLIQGRDEAWLSWRYAPESGRHYRVFTGDADDGTARAFAVTVRDRREGFETGYVVDLAGVDPQATEAAVRAGCRALRDDGVHLALAVVSCMELAAPLQAVGFKRVPVPISPKRFHTVYRPRPGHARRLAALDDIRKWYQTLGDWDTA